MTSSTYTQTTRPVELLDGSAKSCDQYAAAVRGDRTSTRAAYLAAELAAFCR